MGDNFCFFPSLQHLTMDGSIFTPSSPSKSTTFFELLANKPRSLLKSFSVKFSLNFNDDILRVVSQFPELESLDVSGTAVTDEFGVERCICDSNLKNTLKTLALQFFGPHKEANQYQHVEVGKAMSQDVLVRCLPTLKKIESIDLNCSSFIRSPPIVGPASYNLFFNEEKFWGRISHVEKN